MGAVIAGESFHSGNASPKSLLKKFFEPRTTLSATHLSAAAHERWPSLIFLRKFIDAMIF
jgi:hypothetical protein